MKVQPYSNDFSYHCCHCGNEASLSFFDGDVFAPPAFLVIEEKGFSVYASRLFFKCEKCKNVAEFVELYFMPKEETFFEKGHPTDLTNKYIFKNEPLNENENPSWFLVEGLFPLAEEKTTVLQYETPQGPLLEVWLGFFSLDEIHHSGLADKTACNAIYTLKNGFPFSGFKEGQKFEDWGKFSKGFLPWFLGLERQFITKKPQGVDVPF